MRFGRDRPSLKHTQWRKSDSIYCQENPLNFRHLQKILHFFRGFLPGLSVATSCVRLVASKREIKAERQ